MHCFGSFQSIYCKLYVFKSPSICFQGTKDEINRQEVVYSHSVVYLYCRRFYNGMGLVPKFRNGKRCRRKLEKQNIRLKPEMTDYWCFSPRRILRFPRYSLTFGLPWSLPSVHSPWYQWHNCSSIVTWHGYKHYFDSVKKSNRQGLLRCASLFLFRARFLWMQISYGNGNQCACAPCDCVPLGRNLSL